MAKIKLGSTPKSFKKVIKFQMLDGSEGSIEVTYKYRTRKQFGDFVDGILEAAGEKKGQSEDEKFSMAKMMERTGGSNVDYLMDAVEGWNLDEEFSKENVQQLADEIPAAVIGIMETYRIAITEGRLGN